MNKNLQKRKLWCTWESQRRNRELSAAFGAELLEINLDKVSRLERYFYSIVATFKAIKKNRPEIVFAQCPSIVLSALCQILRPFFGFTLVLDAHNAAIEHLSHPSGIVRFLACRVISNSDFIIVSNFALKRQIENQAKQVLVLPDKLPQLRPQKEIFPIRKPAIIYISSFATDEPTELFLKAFSTTASNFTLYVTGKRSRAVDLLGFESDKIIFTDYLPNETYDRLIIEADLLIDLTTRPDCLVCGAYEALSAGKPCILSDSAANRSLFANGGFLFSQNSEGDFKLTIENVSSNITRLSNEMDVARKAFVEYWEAQFKSIQFELDKTN